MVPSGSVAGIATVALPITSSAGNPVCIVSAYSDMPPTLALSINKVAVPASSVCILAVAVEFKADDQA